jgi:hypothetical protein
MLVRHCNRCDKIIKPKENYSSYEEKFHNGIDGYSIQGEFDLCEKCSKELDKFLENRGNE